MTVYVDSPVWKKSPNGRKSYSHMVASTRSELDAFATKIGVKPHFWHAHATMPHYDITGEQCIIALANGAINVSSRELVAHAKEMK